VTPLVTVVPHATAQWLLTMRLFAGLGDGDYAAPTGAVADAANTFTLTSFSAADFGGTPFSPSSFTSRNGFDYGTSTPTTPVPAPASALLVLAGVAVFLGRRGGRAA
jgi:hypothetical protein